MSELWITILAVTVGTFVIKASGPILIGEEELSPTARAIIALLAPALLTALVVVETVGGDGEIVLDARLAGVGAAALALWLRAPILLVILVAVLVTAGVRALGG
jgi:branched-subunit amino acid transport protein